MNKKRIAVIGKGTAGSLSLANFIKKFPDHEIQWYFDPNRPAQSVGEGSPLNFSKDMNENLSFFYSDIGKINGTLKTGIYKENWGKVEKSFLHPFLPPSVAIHFSAVELQKYIYDSVKDQVTIIEQEVSPDDIDADFIMDASGTPKDFSDFHRAESIPVNAAHVVQCAWDSPRFDYTLTIATKHGWIFGIPLNNRCSIGYVYNSNISTVEDLQEDMQRIFAEYDLTPSSEPNNLKFNNYYRKENYSSDGRIAHNGNASFFLEPLEATSIAVMSRIYKNTTDVWQGRMTPEEANNKYLKQLRDIELIIMLHYAAGSPFDSPFWEHAQKLGIEKVEKAVVEDKSFMKAYELTKGRKFHNIIPTVQDEKDHGVDAWMTFSYEVNLNAMGLFPIIDKIIDSKKNETSTSDK